MEICIRGDIIKYLFIWSYTSLLRIYGCIQRRPPSKRNIIIAGACFVYLFFVVSQVGHFLPHQDRRTYNHKYKSIRGSSLETDDDPFKTVYSPAGENTDIALSVVPTRSNVVYITLKSKRLKPAIIRGTVKPKLRSKTRRTKSNNYAFITQDNVANLEREVQRVKRTYGKDISWKAVRRIGQTSPETGNGARTIVETESHVSSIRIYSERSPPWYSKKDIDAMRFLADGKVSRINEVSYKSVPPFLMFETTTKDSPNPSPTENDFKICRGLCGIIKSPIDTSEVFAFHLDRVLGLNKSLPAVSRRFSYFQDEQPCPVVLWDASLYPGGSEVNQSAVRLTWGQYQSSLKQRCWHRNISPKPGSSCTSIHHYEWSKLALFDFLLQIYKRLDQSCCGFRPRPQDECVELDQHADCGDEDSIALANIIHRGDDPRHLVFSDNKGFFDRDEDNLDFKLLEGIKELPEHAVGVLRSQRLRERLLQALFLDRVYWESQGGRQGIERLIDVIERRARVLLTYINAHGVRVVPMNV
ncbi:Golgi-associated kinase 1B [Osmerus mordax]|uniref:Golgi-associated kinase 1B n=1 Tax=Osmerus mordax TaxID=8014 RepID=UPI00350F433C